MSTPYMRYLAFKNKTARPMLSLVMCSAESVPAIMAWYGAYHAGDKYTASLDGRKILMDKNGRPIKFEDES